MVDEFMRISKDTHTQVCFWILNTEIRKFDSIAENIRMNRSELLRTCITAINSSAEEK